MRVSIRVIEPGPFNPEPFWAETRREMNKHIARLKREFQRTTKGWKHQPTFHQKSSLGRTIMMIEVGTNDQIYSWVSDGTPPHQIPSGGSTFMAFRENYSPSTTPGSLDSKANSESGALLNAYMVQHPGITAREFDRLIMEKWGPELVADLQAALGRGAVLSGHAFGGGAIGSLGRAIAIGSILGVGAIGSVLSLGGLGSLLLGE